MRRNFLILFILSAFVLVVCSGALAAKKSDKYKVNKLLDGTEKTEPGYHKASSMGPTTSPGIEVGRTWYDYQSNGTIARQVALAAGSPYLHFVWMKGFDPDDGLPRKVSYTAYNLTSGTFSDVGGWDAQGPNDPTIYGYTSCAVKPSDGAVVWAYHGGESEDLYSSFAGIDASPPLHFFTWRNGAGPINCQGIITGGYELTSKYIWPVVDYADSGGVDIMHMVTCESPPSSADAGEIQTMTYYRTEATGLFPGCEQFMDSVFNICPVVRVDPTDNAHTALVYGKPIYYDNDPNDPCGYTQWQNDVCYFESFDYGKNWTGPINITDYTQGGTVEITELPDGMLYTDLSAMYDSGGKLHVVWVTALKDLGDDPCNPDDPRSRMWHWDDGAMGCISIVYDASKPGKDCDPDRWNLNAAKPNISECNGKMYVSFTRFGAQTDPLDDDKNTDNSGAATPYANGEIFLTASNDGGVTWGEAINLTNSPSPGCDAGDCDSDHWPSMAMYSTDSLHIEYINDKDPGGWAGGASGAAGEPTDNPVLYISHPCFTPDTYCDVGFSPLSVGYPTFISPQGVPNCTGEETATFNVTITNVGNQTTNYTLTSNAAWLLPASATGGLPAGCGNTATVQFTIGPINGSEGIYSTTIDVEACEQVVGTITLDIPVYCEFFLPEFDTLSTSCWSVGVWNVPRAGIAQRGDEGNMYWFSEEEAFMYDESIIVTYADDTANTSFSIFDGSDSDVDFRALDSIITMAGPNYEYSHGSWCTQDTAIVGEAEFWAPTHPDTCVLIERVKICNNTESTITIHIGEGIDWDIPESGSNHGGIDASRDMLYQYSATSGHESWYGGASFCEDVAGGVIVQNDEWVYNNAGYYPAEVGGLLARQTTFENLENADPDSAEDLSVVYAVAQDVVLEPAQCTTFCKVKAGSLAGLGDLQSLIDKGKAWIVYNGLPCTCTIGPSCAPGDANGSGGDIPVDIDDAVYLINFIFGGGPPPVEDLCCGDANASGGDIPVDIDDVVYIINFIFGGGPAPLPAC